MLRTQSEALIKRVSVVCGCLLYMSAKGSATETACYSRRTNKKEKETKGTKLKQLFDVNVGLKSVCLYRSLLSSVCLLSLFVRVCGLRIKLETWQCIYREQPSPLCTTHPPQLALLAQLFYLREGCCCCHLAKASHCKLATKWLRQMGYVIKCGYSNCMYASLHVVSLCVCSVYVCGSVGVWLFECVSLFSIASQPEWELG